MQGHTAAGSFDRRALHVARAEGGEGSLERIRGGIVERQRWQPRVAHGQARVVGEGLGAVDTARRGVEPGVDQLDRSELQAAQPRLRRGGEALPRIARGQLVVQVARKVELRADVPTCYSENVPTCLLAYCLPSFRPSFLPSLPPSLPTYSLTYLRADVPTYPDAERLQHHLLAPAQHLKLASSVGHHAHGVHEARVRVKPGVLDPYKVGRERLDLGSGLGLGVRVRVRARGST